MAAAFPGFGICGVEEQSYGAPQHANTVPFSLSLDLGKVACFQVPALTFPQSRTVTPVGSPQASFSLKWRGVVVQYFIKTTEWNKNTRSLLSSVFFFFLVCFWWKTWVAEPPPLIATSPGCVCVKLTQ